MIDVTKILLNSYMLLEMFMALLTTVLQNLGIDYSSRYLPEFLTNIQLQPAT